MRTTIGSCACMALAVAAGGWAAPAAAQQGPKVLVIYDMEGVSQIVTPADCSFGTPGYPAGRDALTEDVNAAINGLFRGGAREVVITDGHGSGNPAPDYDLTRLPPGARFEIRDAPYDAYIDVVDSTFDAVVAIAMHARANTPGFISHTYFGHTTWNAGGLDMNESMLVAASAARFGVPLILVTGDDVLGGQVAAFSPRTRYVVVKTAESRSRAVARPRADVSRDIAAAAEDAMRDLAGIPAWRPATFEGRFENVFGYNLSAYAALAANYPGARVVNDRAVAVETSGFLDAYLTFRALALFTSPARTLLAVRALPDVEGGAAALQAAAQSIGLQPTFVPAGETPDITPFTYRTYHGYH
jgi:D-amino peptidase